MHPKGVLGVYSLFKKNRGVRGLLSSLRAQNGVSLIRHMIEYIPELRVVVLFGFNVGKHETPHSRGVRLYEADPLRRDPFFDSEILEGSWYLLTNYNCTYNPTYNWDNP